MGRRIVSRLGARRTALLGAALVAVLALVPILLVTTGGSGKRTSTATVASAPVTKSTSPPPQAAAATRHLKAAVRHRQRRAAAVKHPHHHSTAAPHKNRSSTTPATPTTSAATTSAAPKATTPTSSITFDVLGRSGDATSSVCGAPRHYHTYRTGETLGISGRVKPIPSAIWKVKVKIEICSGAAFTEFVKIEPTVDKHRGTFTGSFPAPAPGFYRARAELYVNDVRTVDSTDEHFKTH